MFQVLLQTLNGLKQHFHAIWDKKSMFHIMVDELLIALIPISETL